MAKVANTDPFKNFPGWNPVEKHKNHGQNQKASHMEPFGGNLWHCEIVFFTPSIYQYCMGMKNVYLLH